MSLPREHNICGPIPNPIKIQVTSPSNTLNMPPMSTIKANMEVVELEQWELSPTFDDLNIVQSVPTSTG